MPDELFPIRTVSSLTGVNAITLRAWERRYGLVRPVRTAGGHRLYTQADIDTIQRVTALLERGVPISRARAALDQAVTDPRATPAAGKARRATSGTPEITTSPWRIHRDQMVAAIASFDEERLDRIHEDLLATHPLTVVTDRVLLPLLLELGERWERCDGSVAEEHFFSTYMRNRLGARFHHRGRPGAGPRLLVAGLEGEQHEFGMLLFALAAHERGFRVVLMGANLPLGEVATAARRAQVHAVVLSSSIEPPVALLGAPLSRAVLEAEVPVFVGGLTSVTRHDAIVAAGATCLGAGIEGGLRRLGAELAA